MATAAHIPANQANAQPSTGPCTGQGKSNSSPNRLSHGLTSREFILLSGEQTEFDEFMTALRDAIHPVGALEFDLFTQLAQASWKLRRIRRAEVRIFEEAGSPGLDPLLVPETEARLCTLQISAQRAEHTHKRAIEALRALQSARAFKASGEFVRLLADAKVDATTPLAENYKIVGSRVALAMIEAKGAANRAMARVAAYIDAPPPSRTPGKNFVSAIPSRPGRP